jgi:hypothetical protein
MNRYIADNLIKSLGRMLRGLCRGTSSQSCDRERARFASAGEGLSAHDEHRIIRRRTHRGFIRHRHRIQRDRNRIFGLHGRDCVPRTVPSPTGVGDFVGALNSLSIQNGVGDFVGARIFVRDCSFPERCENLPNQKNRGESRSSFGRFGN